MTEVELADASLNPATQVGTYEGKVKSKKGVQGQAQGDIDPRLQPPFVIGTARSDEFGRWTIDGPVPPVGDAIIIEVEGTGKCKSARAEYRYTGHE